MDKIFKNHYGVSMNTNYIDNFQSIGNDTLITQLQSQLQSQSQTQTQPDLPTQASRSRRNSSKVNKKPTGNINSLIKELEILNLQQAAILTQLNSQVKNINQKNKNDTENDKYTKSGKKPNTRFKNSRLQTRSQSRSNRRRQSVSALDMNTPLEMNTTTIINTPSIINTPFNMNTPSIMNTSFNMNTPSIIPVINDISTIQ